MPARHVSRGYCPWNKGLLVGQKKPLEPKLIWSIRVRLEIARSMRDLAILNLAIDSKLRASDLVKLRLDDICLGANVRRRATIVQKKMGRPVQFEIAEQSRSSVEAWLPMLRTTGSRYLFPSHFMQVLIFQRANMLGWFIAGSRALAWRSPLTARTQCGVRRSRRFIARPVIFALFNCSLVTLS
jgi:integrase